MLDTKNRKEEDMDYIDMFLERIRESLDRDHYLYIASVARQYIKYKIYSHEVHWSELG